MCDELYERIDIFDLRRNDNRLYCSQSKPTIPKIVEKMTFVAIGRLVRDQILKEREGAILTSAETKHNNPERQNKSSLSKYF